MTLCAGPAAQFNTCFWALVKDGKSPAEAQAELKVPAQPATRHRLTAVVCPHLGPLLGRRVAAFGPAPSRMHSTAADHARQASNNCQAPHIRTEGPRQTCGYECCLLCLLGLGELQNNKSCLLHAMQREEDMLTCAGPFCSV
jgi:hypothetical protein